MRTFGLDAADRPALVAHFQERGWVAVDALSPGTRVRLADWVDEVAAWPADSGAWMQHFESTDAGPALCRSENFVPFHDELRELLTHGAVPEVASALLGEPAVLYKEKVNYKAPGGAGYSAHQDAPAYPLIDTHVSAMIAVDAADETNGCLEVVSGAHRERLPMDERGCLTAATIASFTWEPLPVPAGATLVVPQPDAPSQRPEPVESSAAGSVPHLQRRLRRRPPRRVLRREAGSVRDDGAHGSRPGVADR